MLTVYGSRFCPYCQQLIRDYDAGNVEYEFHDISDGLMDLKLFLQIRDKHDDIFAEAKSEGRVGIPIVVTEDGTVTNDWRSFI